MQKIPVKQQVQVLYNMASGMTIITLRVQTSSAY